MAIAIALLGFNDLGHSVTPTLLFRNRFYLQLSPHCPKMNRKFCPRDMESWHRSCGCKVRETMVAKCESVLCDTSPVDLIRLIGPFKPYMWQRTFSFKALIAIFWDLQALLCFSLTKPDLLRVRCSSGHVLSITESVTPIFFFTFLTSLTHHLSAVKFSEKYQC